MPKLSIHVVLLAIIAALVAPAAVFLGLIVYSGQVERSERILRTGDQVVSQITSRLESEFSTARTMLAVFASSGWLQEGDFGNLHRRAQSALRGTNRYLIVVDENGRQIVNTRVAYGTPLGLSADSETINKVLETGIDAVSNLFEGRVADQPVYNVIRRADLPDGRRLALILTRNASTLSGMLSDQKPEGGWSLGVFDGNSRPVYVSLDGPDAADDIHNCEQRHRADVDLPPSGLRIVQRMVRLSEWYTCAWADVDEVTLAGGTGLLMFVVLWGVGAMASAIALGLVLSRSIAGAARVAEAIGSGAEIPVVSSPFKEISDVLGALSSAARGRQEKDAALTMLARESAHRAKNQIAIATSLLRLAARRATSVDQLRDDMVNRLGALARSVDTMVGGTVDAAPLARVVELQLRPFVNDQDELLRIAGDHFMISRSAAQSFGLILHEFGTNASKYGAWAQPGGHVSVSWRITGDRLVFDWTEVGCSPGKPGDAHGFGTTLVDFLVERSFRGSVERSFHGEGFSARIDVPTASVAMLHTADEAEDDD